VVALRAFETIDFTTVRRASRSKPGSPGEVPRSLECSGKAHGPTLQADHGTRYAIKDQPG